MSASKENIMQLQRGVFLSKQRRSLKNLYNNNSNNNQSISNNNNFYTTLQNGFGQRKLGRKASQGSSMQGSYLIDFSKTIGVVGDSNNNVWVRPQSKHSGRNVINVTRPETSKGSRKQPLQMNNTMKVCEIIRKQPQLQQQQHTSTLHKTTTTATTNKKLFKRQLNTNNNNTLNNKQSQQRRQLQHNAQLGSKLMMFNNWQKYNPSSQQSSRRDGVKDHDDDDINNNDDYINDNNDIIDDIDIVVNNRQLSRVSNKFNNQIKKGISVYRNKFQTDLDDQFLELFAD